VQVPEQHVPEGAVHACPQEPQLLLLVERFAQIVLQTVPPERKQALETEGPNPIPVIASVIVAVGVVVTTVVTVVGVAVAGVVAGTVAAIVGVFVLPASMRTQRLFSGIKPSLQEHCPCWQNALAGQAYPHPPQLAASLPVSAVQVPGACVPEGVEGIDVATGIVVSFTSGGAPAVFCEVQPVVRIRMTTTKESRPEKRWDIGHESIRL